MAKTKEETTTMEEIVDSVTKPEKITNEELANLQATIRNMMHGGGMENKNFPCIYARYMRHSDTLPPTKKLATLPIVIEI